MASEVDIANLALGHLGDNATVSSLYPPEGSAQAEHCARFYPIARDSLLEMHSWGFSTKRANLALLGSAWPEWQYCYQQPSDALNLLAVLPQDATSDYTEPMTGGSGESWLSSMGVSGSDTVNVNGGYLTLSSGIGMPVAYTPQPYSSEALDDGTPVIYTNVENAVLRYTARVTDTTKFSPLFTDCLAWLLASYLAGPIIKGDVGAQMAQACYKVFLVRKADATTSDANQRRVDLRVATPWVVNR